MTAKKNLTVSKTKSDLPIALRYAEKQLKLVKEFKFPEFKKWEINWPRIESIHNDNLSWFNLKIYKELEFNKNQSAIYYFNSTKNISSEIYNSFRSFKRKSLIGSAETVCHNICNVPKYFTETPFLYVGSVKRNLHLRLLSHLGYGHPKTGALFLKQVLSEVKKHPKFYFNYCFLDPQFVSIRTLAEYEKQRQFMPLLGSRSFINSEGHFIAYVDHKYGYSE